MTGLNGSSCVIDGTHIIHLTLLLCHGVISTNVCPMTLDTQSRTDSRLHSYVCGRDFLASRARKLWLWLSMHLVSRGSHAGHRRVGASCSHVTLKASLARRPCSAVGDFVGFLRATHPSPITFAGIVLITRWDRLIKKCRSRPGAPPSGYVLVTNVRRPKRPGLAWSNLSTCF